MHCFVAGADDLCGRAPCPLPLPDFDDMLQAAWCVQNPSKSRDFVRSFLEELLSMCAPRGKNPRALNQLNAASAFSVSMMLAIQLKIIIWEPNRSSVQSAKLPATGHKIRLRQIWSILPWRRIASW